MSKFNVLVLNKVSVMGKTGNGFNIFKHYIADFEQEKKPFKAVFRTDKHPSANIFQSTSGEYLYKDFADGKPLNAIDFVMEQKKCTFYDALVHINNDLKLDLKEVVNRGTFQSGGSTEYWNQFVQPTNIGYMYSILEIYQVEGVKSYVTGKAFTVTPTLQNPAFAFKLAEGYTKIYKPLENNRAFKHLYLGTRPKDYNNIFGLAQLPEYCKTVLLVEGFKDCIVSNANLNEEDIYAVGLDNVSTNVTPEIVQLLRSKCDNVVLCLDVDERGIEGSQRKSEKYGLRNYILPDILKQAGGKDISDWFRLKLDKKHFLNSLGEVLASPEPQSATIFEDKMNNNPTLLSLLNIEKQLAERSKQPIIYSPPLIYMGESPIIRRGTINIIQGRYGSHKSRLAELFCSLLLTNTQNCPHHYLQFKKANETVTVAYIDTERNIKEEFVAAIQSIKQKACYTINDETPYFRFTSIKSVERSKRLEAVKIFVEEVRSTITGPMVVLLDVITDCVGDFNCASESMKLFDYLGNLCDNYDCTFLGVIHQNPNSDKARGHTGTEAANKASTVMQIGFEKGRNHEDTDLISLKFLKMRSAGRPHPLYLRYDETQKGLVLAKQDFIQKTIAERKQVAAIESMTESLRDLLKPSLSQKELLQKLKSTFNCSENTLKARLEEIADQKIEINNEQEHPCILQIKTANGKTTVYELKVIEPELDLY